MSCAFEDPITKTKCLNHRAVGIYCAYHASNEGMLAILPSKDIVPVVVHSERVVTCSRDGCNNPRRDKSYFCDSHHREFYKEPVISILSPVECPKCHLIKVKQPDGSLLCENCMKAPRQDYVKLVAAMALLLGSTSPKELPNYGNILKICEEFCEKFDIDDKQILEAQQEMAGQA